MSEPLSRRAVISAFASLGLGAGMACRSDQDSLPKVSASDDRPGQVRALVRAIRTDHRLPGLAAALIRNSGDVVSGVDGVRRWGGAEAIALDDLFHIASCTKSMTATLAAIAVHRRLLDWSTSLAEVVPELGVAVRPEYRGATLEQLLAHAARMPPFTQPDAQRVAWMNGLSGPPIEQRLEFLRVVLSTEPPNEASGNGGYSNVGYVAACAMLERVTATAWEDLLRRDLTEPLGLRRLGFGYPASPSSPHQPHGHATIDGRIEVLPFDPARELAVCLRPAGAVHVSIGDLARYASDHLNGLTGRPALLPTNVYTRLHSPLPGSTSVFTLGWGVRQDDRLGRLHFGAGSGGWFFAQIWIAPERDAAIVVASNSGDAAAATREVAERLLSS